MSSRGEGAVIDRKARTVRLRHEPPGFLYELRGEGDVLEVVRVDLVVGGDEAYGFIHLKRGRWRPEVGNTRLKDDALAMVARAWTCAGLLKPKEPPETAIAEPSSAGRSERR